MKGEKIRPKKPSDWWLQGASARRAGRERARNPYDRNTSPSYRWDEGWEYEDQQLRKAAR